MIAEKEGFEFRGYKLGQEVMYRGYKTKIIGFYIDSDDSEGEGFIAIEYSKCGSSNLMKNTLMVTHRLSGCEQSYYLWVDSKEIEILNDPAKIQENTLIQSNKKHTTMVHLSEEVVWRKKDIIFVRKECKDFISVMSKSTKEYHDIEYSSTEERDKWFAKIIEQING